jgi:hypothetical protein
MYTYKVKQMLVKSKVLQVRDGMFSYVITVCFFLISGVGLWVLQPLSGLLYQPQMIDDGDCGEIGGMEICM